MKGEVEKHEEGEASENKHQEEVQTKEEAIPASSLGRFNDQGLFIVNE